jgi:hypothetical protein
MKSPYEEALEHLYNLLHTYSHEEIKAVASKAHIFLLEAQEKLKAHYEKPN